MIDLSIVRETLPNGFRFVAIDLPGRRSVTNFLAIRSGSRYETADNSGVAHFLEHLVFKGTAKYPTNEAVAAAIERIGGTLNAWTDYDHTAYWNVVPAAAWEVGAELPFELAFAPKMLPADIERERGVIIEEIRMLQDDPARFVHDLATELAFAGHPLERPIIGHEATINAMTPEHFKQYRQEFYIANHCVFVVAGDLSKVPVVAAAKARASQVMSAKAVLPERLTKTSQQQIRLLTKPTDQTHFVLSSATPTAGLQANHERYAGYVLNTILGRGMSSRLFLEVREKRGLAYSIHSHFNTLEDGGLFSVYGGVNTDKASQALEAIRVELNRLQEELVTATELTDAQNYIIGANDMQADHGMSLATWYGTDWLLGRFETHDEVAAAVRAVTPVQVRELARQIFAPERLVLALIGPQTDTDPFTAALTRQ